MAETSLPRIGGMPAVGSVLTGSNANWVADPGTVQRRWVRCDTDGANCTDISGATGATYTVGDADLGHTIRFRNDATDPREPTPPTRLSSNRSSRSTTRVAESLGAGDRVHNGIFVRNAIESRCGVPTSAPTVLQPMDAFLYDVFPVGSLLNEPVCLVARHPGPRMRERCHTDDLQPGFRARVGTRHELRGQLGHRSLHRAGNRLSSILPAGESRELIVSQGNSVSSCASYGVTLGADAPFASVRPGLSGDPVEGGTLTASDGAWSGTPAIATSWRRCDAGGAACDAIPGAAGASYTATAADVGSRLRARVTATQGRSVSSDSEAWAVVADLTGPRGTIRLGSRNLRKAIKSGRIPVRTTCNEACSVVLELRVTRKLAKRLKLKKKVVIARVRGAVRPDAPPRCAPSSPAAHVERSARAARCASRSRQR